MCVVPGMCNKCDPTMTIFATKTGKQQVPGATITASGCPNCKDNNLYFGGSNAHVV